MVDKKLEIKEVSYKSSWRNLPRWRREPLYRIEEIMFYLFNHTIITFKDLTKHFKTTHEMIRNYIRDVALVSIKGREISLTNEGKKYITKLVRGFKYSPNKVCYIGKLSFKELWEAIYNSDWRPGRIKFQKKGELHYINDIIKRTPNLMELAEMCSRDLFEVLTPRDVATFMKCQYIDKEIEKKAKLLRFRERWSKDIRKNTIYNVKSFPISWFDLKYSFELYNTTDFAKKYGIAKTNVRERLSMGNIKLRDKNIRVKQGYKKCK